MIVTEAKAWVALSGAARDPALRPLVRSLTRIETATHVGVSDVEYALGHYCGWLELKVIGIVRDSSRVVLRSPFTLEQFAWLATHDAPRYNQRSYLLIARGGKRAWQEWLLLPPRAALSLLQGRAAPSLAQLRRATGVQVHTTPAGLLRSLTT